MPMTVAKACAVTGALIALASACSEPHPLGCDIDDHSNSDWGLTTVGYLPSQCPIPLGQKGETKWAAADVQDPNGYMQYGEIEVHNSNNTIVGQFEDLYQIYPDGSGEIQVYTQYSAATAYSLTYYPQEGQIMSYGADDFPYLFSGPDDGDWVAYLEVRVWYKYSPAAVVMTGSDIPHANTSVTWTSSASAGTEPYSFAWYQDGQLVSSTSSYTTTTGTTAFRLELVVTDATWTTTEKSLWVDVDGVRVTLTGPTIVYYSQNGGTWSASGTGGYEPYTFQWSYEPQDGTGTVIDLGSGSSYSGYPGQGSGILRVVMTDAHGRTNAQTLIVNGIGDPNGGCEPQPPQIICN